MIILLGLLLNSAFAITNFDGCESELVLDHRHTHQLLPTQIAVRGRLGHFEAQGHDDEYKTWMVTDRFIHEEIAPRIDTEIFWLEQGDYVYLLESGNVVAHGYYGEFEKDGRVWFPGRGKTRTLNRPRLTVDANGEKRAFADYKVLQAFVREHEAVVIQTLSTDARARLHRDLGPWIARYQAHQPRTTRLRFGEVVVEPKAFERPAVGVARLTWKRDVLRDPYLEISLEIDGAPLVLHRDQRVIPLDAEHRALGDFRAGEAAAHEDVLRRAARVITLLPAY